MISQHISGLVSPGSDNIIPGDINTGGNNVSVNNIGHSVSNIGLVWVVRAVK